MKKTAEKIRKFAVAHKATSLLVFVALLLAGYWIYQKFTDTGEIRYITAKVGKGALVVSVSGSGQVSSLNQIEIKAKASGDISHISVKDGDKIGAGGLIAKLDAKDAEKSVRDAEINLESAKISLEKLKIEKSDENISADLDKSYDDGFSAISAVFLDLPSVLTGLDDILNESNLGNNAARVAGKTAQNYRNLAEDSYYAAEDSFEKITKHYRVLNINSPKNDIEAMMSETLATTKLVSNAVKNSINFVDFMVDNANSPSEFSSSRSALSTYTDTVSDHLAELLTSSANIKTYKDALPSSDLDIQAAALAVKQKENALKDAKDELLDYFIRAPFSGTIAKVNIKRLDTTSAGAAVATLITQKQLAEISLNEVDVAKIKIGQNANLAFDAIPDLVVSGVVADIDTIGEVSQGVVTYIVKISFEIQDERIKPGMSVSADIVTDIKHDVLIAPNSSLKSIGGESYVESFADASKTVPKKIKVSVGLSNDSESEIEEGLKEGDEIITRTISETAAQAPSIFGSGGNRGGAVRTPSR